MRDFWKIPGCLSVALVALGLSACGASSSKSADPVGTDAAASDAQVGDAAPNLDAVGADASLAALAADFCRQAAGAKCAWAFDCEGISAASRMVLGLAGDDVAECTENASAACVADTADRADRGTLVFDSVEMSDCIEGVGRAPCVPTPAVEWVADWRANVDSRCGRVLGGNVADDGACAIPGDCETRGAVCAEDACREPTLADLQVDCDAKSSNEGVPNADPSCPGRLCVQVGNNAADKEGICSVDCTESQSACPVGAQCLHISSGSTQAFYCTVPCQRDAQCRNDFVCVPVDRRTPLGAKHCWAK